MGESRQQNILITGVAGFVGSNLADRLLTDARKTSEKDQKADIDLRIIGIDNLSNGIRDQVPDSVEFHQLDIRSKDIHPLFEGMDYVFHLGAKTCIKDCQDDPVEAMEINTAGTANVFEAARRAKVKKVIYAETSALYEDSRIMPTPESDVHPKSFYAVSKFASMLVAKAYERFFGLPSTALRYFNVYGPRQDYRRSIPPVMSAFIIKLLRGERAIIYGTGDQKRDFVHVDDINDFHILCLNDARTDNGTFNLGSGNNYSIIDIYKMISELLNTNNTPIFMPGIPGEAYETLADITEAKRIGWSPAVNMQEGLRGMIEFIQKEMKSGRIA
jgi:UDP-glucose 4-epimerase